MFCPSLPAPLSGFVCPHQPLLLQADVVRAAGLSAAAGDWSVHTMQAVNVISGVPHLNTQPEQQVQQQQQGDDVLEQQRQDQQREVSAPSTPSAPDSSPSHRPAGPLSLLLPVSSPPLSGTPPAPPAPAPVAVAAGGTTQQGSASSTASNSTDAIAVVVARAG